LDYHKNIPNKIKDVMLELKLKDENEGRNVRKVVNFILIFTYKLWESVN